MKEITILSEKIDVLKRVKNGHFLKGFMDFVQKSKFFLSVFFTEFLSENNVFDIVERKE